MKALVGISMCPNKVERKAQEAPYIPGANQIRKIKPTRQLRLRVNLSKIKTSIKKSNKEMKKSFLKKRKKAHRSTIKA